jgi:hypothetical protein
MSEDIIIAGWGAVSPAGWTSAELADATLNQDSLPVTEEGRGEGAPMRRFRTVPTQTEIPTWMRHARLRRSSPVARYAVSAALSALGDQPVEKETLGVIFVTMNGCVGFSRRFYSEVLTNPAFASPILFPETVFNAPSSHLSSLLGSPAVNFTLIGDSAQFLGGLDLAVQWLQEGRVPHCLVVASEEMDWLSTEALGLFPGRRIAAEGAAAVYLRPGNESGAIRIEEITAPVLMSSTENRASAAAQMRAALGDRNVDSRTVVCDSRCGSSVWDRPEENLWRGTDVTVFSPAQWLGDASGVAAGWQTVLGCELLKRNQFETAIISALGCSEQALAAVIKRV